MEDVPVRVERAKHDIQDAPSTAEAVGRQHLAMPRNKAAQIDTLSASVKGRSTRGLHLHWCQHQDSPSRAPNLPFHSLLPLS
jgi:hypothetical protein